MSLEEGVQHVRALAEDAGILSGALGTGAERFTETSDRLLGAEEIIGRITTGLATVLDDLGALHAPFSRAIEAAGEGYNIVQSSSEDAGELSGDVHDRTRGIHSPDLNDQAILVDSRILNLLHDKAEPAYVDVQDNLAFVVDARTTLEALLRHFTETGITLSVVRSKAQVAAQSATETRAPVDKLKSMLERFNITVDAPPSTPDSDSGSGESSV